MQIALYIIIGSISLFIGAEGLVRGASSLAIRLGISPLVVGLTVVAFATSSPELVVSIKAAIEGNPGIVVGNVVGSNICNIALILGVAAIISPLSVKTQVIKREIPIMIIVSVILLLILSDDVITRLEGVLLVIGIIVYIILGYKYSIKKKDNKEVIKEFEEIIPKSPYKVLTSLVLIVVGLVLLVFGSNLFVDGAVAIAENFGVSQAVIGLTIVALGTSLPELTTSVVASFKNENDIAIGNAVGSNVFNILSILGISSLIRPIVNTGITMVDLSIMMFFAILILPLSKTKFTLRRWEGALLFCGYIAYIIYLVMY
ncbi:MAG: calcium/sodium antiporter [Bacteroidetes bacterium]|nr:calcium/sodium antiporter [Bacteroidota bacterium]MCH8942168.1 calcium/sodium antiporter [Bacteroidota bacterium]